VKKPANLLSPSEAKRMLRKERRPQIRVAPTGERTAGGRRWPSKKHREYYESLELQRRARNVLWYVIEPRFLLPGGTEARFDFLEVSMDYTASLAPRTIIRIVDVKGRRTASYIRNVKQVRAIYGIEVVEV